MAKIEVRCPICSEWDHIEIPDDAAKKITKGLLTINVTSGMICEHSFFVYVDKNLITRDCFIADIKIDVTKTANIQESDEKLKLERDAIKPDLIKLNLPELIMSYVFRAVFLGKKVLIISDQLFLNEHFVNFFKYIFRNSFEFNLSVISEEDYKKNIKPYKEHLIFKKREILRDKDNLINPKKLEIEKSIVQKFFTEYDLNSALIVLRNEIQKAYRFSKTIVSFVGDLEEKLLTSNRLIDKIEEKYIEKIKPSYLKFLLEIVEYYFKVELPKIN